MVRPIHEPIRPRPANGPVRPQHATKRGCLSVRRWVLVAVIVGCWCGVSRGDEIKLGGFWITDVSIQGIEDGHIVYFNRVGTEFSRPIQNVQAIKLSAYPQLEHACEAIADGDDLAAREALEQVRAKASTRWMQQWVGHLLIDTYDRLGMPHEAVDVFLRLAAEAAPAFYLAHPPVASLIQAPGEVQDTLRQQIALTMQDLAGQPAADALRYFLALLEPDRPAHAVLIGDGDQPTPATANDPGTVTGQAQASVPAGHAGELVLSGSTDVGDAVTQLLLQGQFEQALDAAEQLLATESQHIAMRLYQRGVAQLYLAQASGENSDYYDAGLSFMSVLAYFPQSTYAGPSLVEAGVVHSKIGRPDIAKKLCDRASFVLDAEHEPRYAARLERLIHELDS